jgi:LPPG:FO 2-phospho-L-lactate transferase
VAVSPFVGGQVLKGPTDIFCAHAGIDTTAAGIAAHYGDLLDGIVADEPVDGPAALEVDTLLDSPAARRAVAEKTLEFSRTLSG